MEKRITEINIFPIKPVEGLVAFASFVLDNNLYLGSIGIMTRQGGGYRLVYPTKKVGFKNIDLFHPINKEIAKVIEDAVLQHLENVMNKNDRYSNTNS